MVRFISYTRHHKSHDIMLLVLKKITFFLYKFDKYFIHFVKHIYLQIIFICKLFLYIYISLLFMCFWGQKRFEFFLVIFLIYYRTFMYVNHSITTTSIRAKSNTIFIFQIVFYIIS